MILIFSHNCQLFSVQIYCTIFGKSFNLNIPKSYVSNFYAVSFSCPGLMSNLSVCHVSTFQMGKVRIGTRNKDVCRNSQ